jgi:FMN phosphatase YigB (HAD superfamily)
VTKYEWIPVTMETPMPKMPCLLCDIYGTIYEGYNAFDFYDLEWVKYYFPMPEFPFPVQGFASDEAMIAVLKEKK